MIENRFINVLVAIVFIELKLLSVIEPLLLVLVEMSGGTGIESAYCNASIISTIMLVCI